MKFGIREICDVVLRAKSAQKIGNKIFFKNEPVCYFDTLKTSTLEGAATTVYATGGRGNSRLMSWDGERTVTFSMEDALISPVGLSILTGAGLIESSTNKPIIVHTTEQIALSQAKTDEAGFPIFTLSQRPYDDDNSGSIYVIGLNDNGETVTEPYLYSRDLSGEAESTDIAYVLKSFYSNEENLPANAASLRNCTAALIDYYTLKANNTIQIDITPDKFGGTFYLEASTLWRDQATGKDLPAEFIIPSCKVQSNFSFTMSSAGDPSTFNFTMDAFPDYTRWDKTKKVLASIQLVGASLTDNDELIREETYAQTDKYNVDIGTNMVQKITSKSFIDRSNTFFQLPYNATNQVFNGKITIALTDAVPSGSTVTIYHIVNQQINNDLTKSYVIGGDNNSEDFTLDEATNQLICMYDFSEFDLSAVHAFKISVDAIDDIDTAGISLGTDAWNKLNISFEDDLSADVSASWNFAFSRLTTVPAQENIVVQNYYTRDANGYDYTKITFSAQTKEAIHSKLTEYSNNGTYIYTRANKVAASIRFPGKLANAKDRLALLPLAVKKVEVVLVKPQTFVKTFYAEYDAAKRALAKQNSNGFADLYDGTIDLTDNVSNESTAQGATATLDFDDLLDTKVYIYIRTSDNKLFAWYGKETLGEKIANDHSKYTGTNKVVLTASASILN